MKVFKIFTIPLLLILLSALSALAQLSQSVRGQLLQESSGQAISGALVVLENQQQHYQSISDESGKFEIQQVLPGHYRLSVQHLNYAPYQEPELLVEASKSIYRKILLQESVRALQEVEIAAAVPPVPLNRREFTVAQTQRYPATFFDPARLVLSQPGVAQSNDQANHVVVHGLSPVGIQWRLQGLPVLNPNHLSNAGTRRDRASTSGGGVNMLSGQLMANSAFRTGALPSRFGNAITGVFDISLRPGNLQQREHTLQASLLGIDLATEGPISKGNSSYLVNYRYSTVGLLGHLGVDFGGEQIQFQDLSANLHFENTSIGQVSFFFLGGSNSNRRTPLEEQDWEEDKHRQRIDFEGAMAAAGLSQSVALGKSFHWQNGVALSAMNNERTERWEGPNQPSITNLDDRHKAQQLSAFTRLQHAISRRFNTELGLQLQRRWSTVFANPMSAFRNEQLDGSINHTLSQPYVQLEYALLPELVLQAGLRISHLNWRNETKTEPYGQLTWQPGNKQSWQLSYGRQSQTYTDQLLAVRDELSPAYAGLISSQYVGLGWAYRLSPGTTLSTELYYQYLHDLPASENDLSWNYLAEPFLELSGKGNASTYGLDVQLRRDFQQGWYYLLGASLFDARYQGSNDKEQHSPFNSQWAGSITTGKEWRREQAEEAGFWGAHLRFHSRGGYWYTPIDAAGSAAQNREIEDRSNPFSQQFPTYYTADMRISHTREKKGWTRIWSLDIQNLTNRRNLGWYYYDFLQQGVSSQQQLGIIPVLAYRIQF